MANPEHSIRTILRTATDEFHQETDRLLHSHADVATLQGYTVYLSLMRNTIAAFAPSFDTAAESADLPPRAAALIAALDRDIETSGSASTAGVTRVVTSPGRSFDVGVGYALEGSAVGAAVLRSRVTKTHDDAPTHYLDALARTRRQRWSHFCNWLSAAPAWVNTDEAIDGASQVFQCVQREVLAL